MSGRLTAMNAAHDAFRRDLERLAASAGPADLADPDRHASILAGWTLFTGMLDIHHRAEDDFIWPRLRRRLAGSEAAISVLDEMDAEHARIDPLIAAVDAGLAGRGTIDTAGAIEELRSTLSDHMRHEEREAMPLVEQALSDREWRAVVKDIHGLVTSMESLTVADFVPWLTDGRSPADEKAISTVVPAPVRPVYRLIWKPRYARASRW
jgi:iron-sulfur cluster repair protein YtfE (RIC family)